LIQPIAQKLIAWYQSQRRSLPWRENPFPYHVWVAEIMAQQTRLDTMLPYYERWLARFPTINDLAQADVQEVLLLWEGLGYYQRARNFHAAAQQLVEHNAGHIPETVEELRHLPGIGPYTAGAISSVAFGADEPAVDGNAIRVLSRLFNIELVPASSAGKQAFWNAARSILPAGQASDFNQGLMDLGARICTPRNPDCENCPLSAHCDAFQLGIQEQRPVRKKSAQLPVRYSVSLVILRNRKVQLHQRPAEALLGAMWEFPNIAIDPDLNQAQMKQILASDFAISPKQLHFLAQLKHTYSHFHAQINVFLAESSHNLAESLPNEQNPWHDLMEMELKPMGKIDRTIAQLLLDKLG
jgi:A/G-specific adenine glycosylase